jgi:hypothetical protein
MQFLRTPKEREPPSPAGGFGGYYELSMYKDSPVGEVALEEFEKIALDRLRSEWRGAAVAARHALRTCARPAGFTAGPHMQQQASANAGIARALTWTALPCASCNTQS